MNEHTQEQLNTALSDLITTITQVKDFALEQAPDVVQQLLVWNFVISLIFFLINLLIILGAVWFNIWQIKNWGRLYGYTQEHGRGKWRGVEPINSLQFFLIFPFMFLFHCIDWLQIWIAPKVWLIEYAVDLIK